MSLQLPPSNPAPLASVCPDDSFGPWAGFRCRGGFDFTLLFEEVILGLPVQCLLLLLLLPRMMQLARRNSKVKSGLLRPFKAVR
jgi:ATP-binding cassette subfamily C (CFTR/MRP) protein 1